MSSENDVAKRESLAKFLREKGIDENSPVDVSSKEVLKTLVTKNETQERRQKTKKIRTRREDSCDEEVVVADGHSSPPFDQVVAMPSRQVPSTVDEADDASEISIEDLSIEILSKDDRILKLLEKQSEMLSRLTRKVDLLAAKVDHHHSQLNEKGFVAGSKKRNLTQSGLNERINELSALVDEYREQLETDEQRAAADTTEGVPTNDRTQRLSPMARVRKILSLFIALQRRQAPNFDGFLILKVIFILSVLLGRFGHQQGEEKEDWIAQYRLHLLVQLVVMGFLFQTGLLSFFWSFAVKNNYPVRIWNGEDIDIEAEVQHVPLVQRDANRAQAPDVRNVLRNTFLGGAIIRPREAQNYGPIRFVQDIGLVIGSFFLSIFPMWRPEALAQPEAANDRAGLPEVQPPANPLQAAEED